MTPSPFLFLGDLIETDEQLPLNLLSDLYLKRPVARQKHIVRDFVNRYNAGMPDLNKFESSRKKTKDGFEFSHLDEVDWKYYVIEHGRNEARHHIQIVFSLSSLDLTILFESLSLAGKQGMVTQELTTLNYFHDHQFNTTETFEPKIITKEILVEFARINSLYESLDKEKFSLIDKAVKDFVRLKEISSFSPFKILSCFSILELILTTYRSKSQSDNSISAQLQRKINLLNNRFEDKIEIGKYFKGSATNTIETIIEKLYKYRNDIAHGNISNFETDLHILKNQQKKVLPFLLDLLRRVLMIALEEPQLISDLKEC